MHRILSLTLLACTLLGAPVQASPAQHLAEAVRFRTVSSQDQETIDYAQFDQLHAYLRATYPRVFDALEVEVVNDYSLLLQWPGSDPAAAPVLFTAHMDVVPVEPGTERDWAHPAFAGVVADGRIYGRGTLDDKVGVVGLLEAVDQLLTQGFKPSRRIVLAFGHDEEIGGEEGAGALAQRMQAQGLHFEWMVDEGGLVIEDNPMLPGGKPMALVNVAEKSYLTLTLSATGPGGHSSQPPPITSIGRLAGALARIEANPFEPRLVGPVRAMLETLSEHGGFAQRLVMDNLWATESLVAGQMANDALTSSFVRTSTALTMVNAGVKENVVPQRAQAKINFRLLPGDTADTVIEHIEALVNDPAITISYDRWNQAAPVADYTGSGFAVIREAAESVYPEVVVVPSLLAGATDTRHYIELADNHYRFHGVLMGSEQARSIHGTNEFVTVESFEKSIAVAVAMMRLGAGG